MVHWLDQLSASDRSAMLARLDRLPADARDRVLAVESVDGAPVVVTRMILDFDSFGKWLDRVAPATQAPPPAPPPGGFTDIFVASGAQRGSPVAEIDSPTVSWTPPSVPKAPPPSPPEPKSEPKPHAPAISVRFREPASGPKPPSAPPPPPPKAPAPPPLAPKAPPPKAPAPGEFTRIFGATHVEPEPSQPAAQPQFMPPPPPVAPMSGASATSALERVVAPPPRSAASPPPPPSPASPWSGPPPVVPLPSPSASATPMPGANINLPPAAPVMPAQPVQSDFTRIIGVAGPAPSVAPPPPPAAPAPAPTPPPGAAMISKKILPALLAFGTLVLAALVLVVFALIRRH